MMTNNPTVIRRKLESFMIEHGEPEDVVLPLFSPPSALWQAITVKQSPEVHPEGMVGTHTLKALLNLRVVNKVTLWAALLHDVGKKNTTKEVNGRISAHGHERESVRIAKKIFTYSDYATDYFDDVYDEVLFCIEQHMRIKCLPEMRKHKRDILMSHKYFKSLVEVAYADSMAGLGNLEWFEFMNTLDKEILDEKHR